MVEGNIPIGVDLGRMQGEMGDVRIETLSRDLTIKGRREMSQWLEGEVGSRWGLFFIW